MIKASIGNIVLFGLVDKNLELLKHGNPMKIELKSLVRPGMLASEVNVIILHGRDEETLKLQLSNLMGPETNVLDFSKPLDSYVVLIKNRHIDDAIEVYKSAESAKNRFDQLCSEQGLSIANIDSLAGHGWLHYAESADGDIEGMSVLVQKVATRV